MYCDEVISDIIGRRLIYGNAACQKGKGTHFALDRVSLFLRKYYRKYGVRGYFLKFDIMKYFDNIELSSVTKNRYKRKLKYMKYMYGEGRMNLDEITPVIRSYHAHFTYGNA